MNTNEQQHLSHEKHPKQNFQVERIAFFSDAVFAIAITLLVIEFKAPVIKKETTAAELWEHLGELKYKLVALLLSFSMIVSIWIKHHTLFKHIFNYNRKVILANMLVLLPIIFFPFTTSFLYESINSSNPLVAIPYQLFLINLVTAELTVFYFYWTVMKRFKDLSYPMPEIEKNEFELKLWIITGSFLLVLLVSFISLQISYWGMLPLGIYNLWKGSMAKRFSFLTRKKKTEVKPVSLENIGEENNREQEPGT
jgi:uncharacterized membrane protein